MYTENIPPSEEGFIIVHKMGYNTQVKDCNNVKSCGNLVRMNE